MSAFLQSGRSDQQKLSQIRVRFRPEAAILDIRGQLGLGGLEANCIAIFLDGGLHRVAEVDYVVTNQYM